MGAPGRHPSPFLLWSFRAKPCNESTMIEACPMHVLVRLEMSGGSTEAHEQTMSSEEPRERERESLADATHNWC